MARRYDPADHAVFSQPVAPVPALIEVPNQPAPISHRSRPLGSQPHLDHLLVEAKAFAVTTVF